MVAVDITFWFDVYLCTEKNNYRQNIYGFKEAIEFADELEVPVLFS